MADRPPVAGVKSPLPGRELPKAKAEVGMAPVTEDGLWGDRPGLQSLTPHHVPVWPHVPMGTLRLGLRTGPGVPSDHSWSWGSKVSQPVLLPLPLKQSLGGSGDSDHHLGRRPLKSDVAMGARFFIFCFHWLSFLCNSKNRKSVRLPTKAVERFPRQISTFSSYRLNVCVPCSQTFLC